MLILLDFQAIVVPSDCGRILSAPTSCNPKIAPVQLGFLRYVGLSVVGADIIRPPSLHADSAGFPCDYGVQQLRTDEPPMTACDGNFIGDEISRNKQRPHEAGLRQLSLRERPAPTVPQPVLPPQK